MQGYEPLEPHHEGVTKVLVEGRPNEAARERLPPHLSRSSSAEDIGCPTPHEVGTGRGRWSYPGSVDGVGLR
jgi:hypothetical protein